MENQSQNYWYIGYCYLFIYNWASITSFTLWEIFNACEAGRNQKQVT